MFGLLTVFLVVSLAGNGALIYHQRRLLYPSPEPPRLPEGVARALHNAPQIETWCQPVFLLGPREVGKTSLVRQWLVGAEEGWAPFKFETRSTTVQRQLAEIPLCDLTLEAPRPHFASPDVVAALQVHLKLRVYDFPGEPANLKNFLDDVVPESLAFTRETNSACGVVIVCMFNADELNERVTVKTRAYYDSQEFEHFRDEVIRQNVKVERLVVVFNKIDQLKSAHPHLSYTDLREECRRFFHPYYRDLIEHCKVPPDRVHFEVTMLDPDAAFDGNLNAPRVLSHCAQSIVTMFNRRPGAA